MKKLLLITSMLFGIAYGQCGLTLPDTVFNNSVTLITYNSARLNGDASNGDVSGAMILLRYVRTGHTDTVSSTTPWPTCLRNLTGLVSSTQYTYYYSIYCGGGEVRQLGRYTFTTAAATITYTDERPTRFHYVYADSLLQLPEADTSLYRAPSHPSITYKSSNNTYYGYYPNCTCWRPLAIDSSGIIALLDGKVDSVTVSGDSLFYWKVGVSYGYILPALNDVWRNTGNTGIDTSVNWLGTNDANDLKIVTNGVRRFTVNTNGALGIGAPADYGTSGYVLQTNGSSGSPGWVAASSVGITTASNGLTASGGNVKLGGTLTQNTNITLDNDTLKLISTGAPLVISTDDPGNLVFGVGKTGDGFFRWQLQGDGHQEWLDAAGGNYGGITPTGNGILSLFGNGSNTRFHIDRGISGDTSHLSFGSTDTISESEIYRTASRFGIITGGNMYLHGLTNVSTQDRLLGIVNSSGSSGTVTISSPLSLSSGALSLGVVPIANGGTNNGSLSVTNGNLLYTDGTKVVGLGVGTAGQHLLGGTIPHWGDTATAGGGSQTPWTSDINAAGYKLVGNTTSGGSLTLESTSNGTKGSIKTPTNTMTVDEANKRFGVNSPSGSVGATFEVWNSAGSGYLQVAFPSPAAEFTGNTDLYFKCGNSSKFYMGRASQIIMALDGNQDAVGIGTNTPAASGLLDLTSTTKGFLPPRMTTTERTAISSPAEGLCVYDLTLHKLYVYDGTTWQAAW